jgi:predicted alpha/beta hydrolase
VDAIQPAQMILLRNIYTAINDGVAAAADYFPAPDTAKGNAKAAEVLGITPTPAEPTAATEAASAGELAE